MKTKFIEFALSQLNNSNSGDTIFETFCYELIKKTIDVNIFKSSGLDCGGDGGVDAWSINKQGKKIKYAFSINKSTKTKIKSEVEKFEVGNHYTEIRYFTNMSISQKKKEEYVKEFNHVELVIYDREDLAGLLSDNPELGHLIGLDKVLAEVDIDYVRSQHQLLHQEDTISNYIPREILVLKENELNPFDITECSEITIIHSSAGFGKSCLLKQKYLEYIKEDSKNLLPPVLIELKTYYPGNLSQQIKDALRVGGDHRMGDYILLLDGYDEVKDKHRSELLKEVQGQLINSPYKRKVIITARENILNSRDLSGFKSMDFAFIKPLDKDDIIKLFRKNDILKTEDFFNSSIFNHLSNNIFYVVHFILYYQKHGSIAKNIIELYSFIVQKEFDNIFRYKEPLNIDFESLALYMTLHQELEVTYDDESVYNDIDEKLPYYPFKFSHKSIQEFLAAKKLSGLRIDEIKKVVAIGDKIISHLSNMFGLTLSILNFIDHDKFEELITWSLKGKGNSQKLITIETDKIDPIMNLDIFKAILIEEAPICDLRNIPNGLQSFASSQIINIDYLINLIINVDNLEDLSWHYYSYILQSITLNNIDTLTDIITMDNHKKLYIYFTSLLEDCTIEKNSELIDSLLFSFCYNPCLEHSSNREIEFIVNQILKLKNKSSLIENLSRLLINTKKVINFNLLVKLFDYIYHYKEVEGNNIAGTVPKEIGRQYEITKINFLYLHDFFPLVNNVIEDDRNMWSFLDYIVCKNINIFSLDDREIRKVYDILIKRLKEIDINVINGNEESILLSWITHEVHNSNLDYFWESFVSILEQNNELMEKAIIKIVVEVKTFYKYYRQLIGYLNDTIYSKSDFINFKKTFNIDSNLSCKRFYEEYVWSIPETHKLFNYILENIQEDFKNRILSSLSKRKNEVPTKKITHKFTSERIIESLHLSFYTDKLIEEINKFFEIYDTDKIDHKQFYNFEVSYYETGCPFIAFLLQHFFRNNKDIIQREFLKNYILGKTWDENFIYYLIKYIDNYRLSLDVFDDFEILYIKNWINSFLNKHPLTIYPPSKYTSHHIVSYILINSDIVIETDKIIPLIFSGFPNTISGIYSLNYDSFSIDYLEKFLSTKTIISYIVQNFKYEQVEENVLISICGYLYRVNNEILPFQAKKLKKMFSNYINSHLVSNYQPIIRDFIILLGIDFSDIDEQKFSDSIVLDNESDLAHNYAISFFKYPIKDLSKDNYDKLFKCMHNAMDNTDNEVLKKKIAEYYLSLNKFSGDVFSYYVDWLLMGNSISQDFGLAGMGYKLTTSDFSHIKDLEKLLKYLLTEDLSKTRGNVILELVLLSYKSIASFQDDKKNIDIIKYSLSEYQNLGHKFLNKHIRDIDNAFIERSYSPMKLKDLLMLKS